MQGARTIMAEHAKKEEEAEETAAGPRTGIPPWRESDDNDVLSKAAAGPSSGIPPWADDPSSDAE